MQNNENFEYAMYWGMYNTYTMWPPNRDTETIDHRQEELASAMDAIGDMVRLVIFQGLFRKI